MSSVAANGPAVRTCRIRALAASTVGTTIEWYDFFLYGTSAALVFPTVFFPGHTVYSGILLSFGTQFVGFVARPIGAMIFGHYGDRIGRKTTLISTLLLMGIATFLMGLVPSYAAIGAAAPILLVILRIAQGIGVGGEWGGSVLMSMEWGKQRWRGFMASWPQVGVPVGLLLSTGMVKLFSGVAGSSFDTWGWRVPFLLSIVLVGIGLYVRLRVQESPSFSELKRQKAIVRPQAALIAESFGPSTRYSGAGLGYQLASVIAGGPAPLIAAAILSATASSFWISWYLVGCAVVAMIALLLMPRRDVRTAPSRFD